MNGIGDFLRKYLDFTPPEKIIARAVMQSIKESLDVDIKENQITIQNGVVSISVDTIIKSELLFKKKKILERIAELLKKETVVDIR